MSSDSSKKSTAQEMQDEKLHTHKSHEKLVPWNPLLAVILVIVLYFTTALAALMLVSLYPRLHHWTHTAAENWFTNSIFAQSAFTAVSYGLMFLSIWQFLRFYKFSLAGIGLKRLKGEDILYGLSGFVMFFVPWIIIKSILTQFAPGVANEQQDVGFQNVYGVLPLVLTGISLVVFPPVVEEIMMRGFLYTSLRKNMSKIVAALIVSVIFAVAHLAEGGSSGPLWIGATQTFLLSLVLVFLREKTGRLYASMLLHGINNGLAFLVVFVFHK